MLETHSGRSEEGLRDALDYFRKALLLYDTGAVNEQVRNRYRIAKLFAALGEFSSARVQLRVVEATLSDTPPIVGWVELGLAYLRRRVFSESDHFFRRAADSAADLHSNLETAAPNSGESQPERVAARQVVGSRVDERLWPLGLVRAWAHLGVALSLVERDGNHDTARSELLHAREHAAEFADDPEFPTRVHAACDDCEGLLALREEEFDNAVIWFARAIAGHPFSRTYLNSAHGHLGLLAKLRPGEDAGRLLQSSKRALDHAEQLGQSNTFQQEVSEARQAWEEMVARIVSGPQS